ncbi:MAG: KH domain-containing protein [Acidobacteriota bacterium]|nr:KH domain-containing protein [Acidobacteriota bacterium]
MTEMSLEEQGQAAQTFVEGLLREMGMDATISLRMVDDTTAEVAVDGEGLGVLVGPRGATLSALQELTRTVVQKHTGGHSERILVDVAGYRARRAEALQRFTQQVAAEVLSSGTERALEPMSAADRKVVHDAVNEIDGVVTRSEGEEPRRYIVLSPSADAPQADGSGADES